MAIESFLQCILKIFLQDYNVTLQGHFSEEVVFNQGDIGLKTDLGLGTG